MIQRKEYLSQLAAWRDEQVIKLLLVSGGVENLRSCCNFRIT